MIRHRPATTLVTLGMAAILAACSSAAPSPSSTPSPTPTASPTPSPSASPTPTPKPTPVPLDQALLTRRLTVLILGVDSNPDRASRNMPVNTDSMIVASVNAAHNRIATVALPRDTVNLQLAGGGIWTEKANALFRAKGIGALVGALQTTYGIRIDGYVLINMPDFGRLVNAVGGIDVIVPYALYDAPINLNLAAGRQHLNGNNAARYVRTRDQDSDYARGIRQQQVLIALARKLFAPTTKVNIPALIRELRSMRTNLPLAKLATLIEIGRRSVNAKVTSMELGPPRFALFQGIDPNRGGEWVMVPDVAAMRAYVRSVMGD